MNIEDINPPIICLVKGKRITCMTRGDMMISSIESSYEMVAVERMKSSEKIHDVIAVELVVTQ